MSVRKLQLSPQTLLLRSEGVIDAWSRRSAVTFNHWARRLTILCLVNVQRYRPQFLSNVQIPGDTSDNSLSVAQTVAGQYQFSDRLSCISQWTTLGGVGCAVLPADQRQWSPRRTAVCMDRVLIAGRQQYFVWLWTMHGTYHALVGALVLFSHASLDAVTVTTVDWKKQNHTKTFNFKSSTVSMVMKLVKMSAYCTLLISIEN